jgi:transposase
LLPKEYGDWSSVCKQFARWCEQGVWKRCVSIASLTLINKVEQYRRIFSKFEKLAKNYLGFLSFVSALVRLR